MGYLFSTSVLFVNVMENKLEIKFTEEREDGTVVFQGTLEGPELSIVVETGLNELMKRGLLPFAATESIDPAYLMDVPELDQ